MHNYPLISVIVPVYNVENYLRKCIDSIIAQTYSHIEIIVINDGSTDNCGEICNEYAITDNRIKVIHGKNSGVSAARNKGIDISSGDYVVFVDGDDYVASDYVECLYNKLVENDANIAVCGYMITDINDSDKTVENLIPSDSVILSEEYIRSMLNFELIQGVCCKIFKSEYIKSIRFKNYSYSEDLLFSVESALKEKNIVIIGKGLYHYVTRKDSVIHGGFKYNKFVSLQAFDDILSLLKGTELEDIAVGRLVSGNFSILLEMSESEYPEEYRQICERIKLYRIRVLKTKGIRLKTKCACLLSFLGFAFVKFVFRALSAFVKYR